MGVSEEAKAKCAMQCKVMAMNGSDPSNVIDRYYELFQGDVRDLDSGSGLFDFWNVLT